VEWGGASSAMVLYKQRLLKAITPSFQIVPRPGETSHLKRLLPLKTRFFGSMVAQLRLIFSIFVVCSACKLVDYDDAWSASYMGETFL